MARRLSPRFNRRMLPFKLVYHLGYDLNLGEHVFPSQKYRLIRNQLLDEGFADLEDFVEPQPAPDEDILRVHDPGWVNRLKTGTLGVEELLKLEVTYSRQVGEAFSLATRATVLA